MQIIDLIHQGGTMSLADLWNKSKAELGNKTVQQIIGFAGDGNLKDGSATSGEFRAFLGIISNIQEVEP
jgi:hypothetical protein